MACCCQNVIQALVQGFLHTLGTAAAHVGQAGAGGRAWLCGRPGWEGSAGSGGDEPARARLPSFGGMDAAARWLGGARGHGPTADPCGGRVLSSRHNAEVPGDLCFLSLRASPFSGSRPHEAGPAPGSHSLHLYPPLFSESTCPARRGPLAQGDAASPCSRRLPSAANV